MDFSKILKKYHIICLSEFPSEDTKVEENTLIAIPSENQEQFKLYTWFESKWVYTAFINKSDLELGELLDAHDDLCNIIKKLLELSKITENTRLLEITFKIQQAKHELEDNINRLKNTKGLKE